MRTNSPININTLLNLFRSAGQQQLVKAAEDLQDDVDIDATHVGTGDFQRQLRRVPREHGVPLPASGNGPGVATAEYTSEASQSLANELYSTVATVLSQQGVQIKSLQNAVSYLLADKAGMRKSPDWEGTEAKKEGDDDQEPDEAEIDKAIRAVRLGKASVAQVMTYLQYQREPLRQPPDLSTPMQKSAITNILGDEALFESRLDLLAPSQAQEGYALRARVMTAMQLGLPIKGVLAQSGAEISGKLFPELTR